MTLKQLNDVFLFCLNCPDGMTASASFLTFILGFKCPGGDPTVVTSCASDESCSQTEFCNLGTCCPQPIYKPGKLMYCIMCFVLTLTCRVCSLHKNCDPWLIIFPNKGSWKRAQELWIWELWFHICDHVGTAPLPLLPLPLPCPDQNAKLLLLLCGWITM